MIVNLYEINAAIMAVIGTVEDELTAEQLEQLNALAVAESDKLENIACFIKNLEAEAKAIRDEEKTLADRRKAKDNRADGLRAYLDGYLTANNKRKFETSRVVLSYRKAEAVEIFDDAAVTADGRFVSYEPKYDKVAMRNALKCGDAVPGVQMVTRERLQIK